MGAPAGVMVRGGVMALCGGCDPSGGELATFITVADMNSICQVNLIIADDRNMPSPVYKI